MMTRSLRELPQLIRLQWNSAAHPSVRLASVILILAYFVQETQSPGRETGVFVISFLILLALQIFGDRLDQIDAFKNWFKSRWQTLMGLALLYLTLFAALLFPALTISISGDEGWHIQKANPLLAKIQELAEHGRSLDFVMLSKWGVFDWDVATAWNLLRFPTLLSGLGLLILIFRPIRFGRLIQVLFFLSVFSIWLQSLVDPHAPLRIFPTLVAQTILGLSDFSNRMGGPAFAAVFCALFGTLALSRFPKAHFSLKLGLLALPIVPFSNPQIFFTIPLVESSSFGIWFWIVTVVLCGLDAHENSTKRLSFVAWAFTIGILFRQGLIALAPFFAICYWPRRRTIPWKDLLPLAILVPYFATVASQSSAAMKGSVTASFLSFFKLSWVPDITQNFGFPHLVGLLVPMFFAARYSDIRATSAKILTGSLASLLFYFLLAKEYLFPAGRYQAEYVGASFCGLLILQIFLIFSISPEEQKTHRVRMNLTFAGIILLAGLISNVQTAWDFPVKDSKTGNSTYLVTAPFFPFEEAIEQIGNNPKFVVAGGSPYISQARLWNHRASFNSSLAWTRLNWKWRSIFEPGASAEDLKNWLLSNQVEYILKLSDSPREIHHRTAQVQESMQAIDQLVSDGLLTLTYASKVERGDQIKIYRLQ